MAVGFWPTPAAGEEDPELINAGKEYVTMLEGGSFFHHGDSFAMMRGGHLDIASGHFRWQPMVTCELAHGAPMRFLLLVVRWI
ncbi:3-oxoadipate CoA-transferase subunit B domain protein [Acinetobacter baumannii OIFC098]|nr:3-oxoadipate CoA-transferase subunit B domain protein [Acinetobacter baumannii OIFC098]